MIAISSQWNFEPDYKLMDHSAYAIYNDHLTINKPPYQNEMDQSDNLMRC